MTSRKLSQIYKQYLYSILSLVLVLYETRYNKHNYFWYYRPFIIDLFTTIAEWLLL